MTTGTILDQIMEVKRSEVRAARENVPLQTLQQQVCLADPCRDFLSALQINRRMHLIAEVKKASPVKGEFRADFDPLYYVKAYETSAASAISIITDKSFFHGDPATLRAAATWTTKPRLRKDFIFTEYQVWQTRAWGADAVLLVAAVLPPAGLQHLIGVTCKLGMAALVEVHTEAELRVALDAGATLIGINNRDLRTFCVDLGTTLRLREMIPDSVRVISESGINTREDVLRLQAAKVNAVLVGEALIRADNPQAKIRELLGIQ